jgi:hypothetical protein
MNPYETYAKAAHSRVTAPQRLVGSIKTRSEGRTRYTEICVEIKLLNSTQKVDSYLTLNASELAQFAAEMPFYYDGDGAEMLGIAKEIELAFARCDDVLDLPRWDPGQMEAEKGTGI